MAVKKKRGAKAAKAKKQEKKSSKLAKTDTDLSFSVKDKDGPKDAAKPRDPTVPAKRAQLASKGKAIKSRARTAEREQRRLHVPFVDHTSVDEPPPLLVAVMSPPGVGKSTLIRCLVKHYTRQSVGQLRGPITVVASKKRRLTFIECPNDLCGMIDVAKSADLVLLMIDGEFGFEMETFEFLMLMQQHGMPKVIGVLNHLDAFKDSKKLKKVKTGLRHRFEAEVSHGAKLFYLSSIRYGKYLKREVMNLARFISVAKTRPLSWRLTHPYFIADRFEDITHKELVRQNPKCDRSVVLFGYLRGCNLRMGQRIHIAGVDDFTVSQVDQFPDPCPLPHMLKKRTLNEQERRIYAPMSDVGGLLYDRDATYIEIPDWKRQYTRTGLEVPKKFEEGEAMMRELQETKDAVDERLGASAVQLFTQGDALPGDAAANDVDSDDASMEDDEEEEEEEDVDGAAEEHESDSSDEEEDTEQQQQQPDARKRRRAVFAEDEKNSRSHTGVGVKLGATAAEGDNNDMEGSEGESEEEGDAEEASDGEEEEREEETDGESNTAWWRANMLSKQAAIFAVRASDLKRMVYGSTATKSSAAQKSASNAAVRAPGYQEDDEGLGEDEDGDELFQLKSSRSPHSSTAAVAKHQKDSQPEDIDVSESPYLDLDGPAAALSRWQGGAAPAVQGLRHRIVTGGDAAFSDAHVRSMTDGLGENDEQGSEDEEVYGDFEDVEMGKVFSGSSDPATKAAMKAITDETQQQLAAKLAKKAEFDSKYDGGGSRAVDKAGGGSDEDEEGGTAATKHADSQGKKKGKGWALGKEEETYFDHLKKEIAERQASTRAELDSMDVSTRETLEGFRAGSYIRLRLTQAPCELVECFTPNNPVLVGGLGQGEEKVGYMHLRLKRHRWFPKLLKNLDPLVMSAGWRRYQTLPVLSQEDNNGRHRMLKYTPEHMHCRATVFGPLVPPQTGIIAVQNLASGLSSWRISATAVVMELDAKFDIMKKLKLVGHPYRIERHTAYIKDMFTSEVEVAKFIGAAIQTASGIRGTVKKSVQAVAQDATPGCYRATFEDKLVQSDIVIMKAWVAVQVPKFFNPVTNLLARGSTIARGQKQRAVHKRTKADTETHSDSAGEEHFGGLEEGTSEVVYASASHFMGAKPNSKFCLGPCGLGYYTDWGANAGYGDLEKEASKKQVMYYADQPGGSSGWVGARTVAQIRRGKGVGAPRDKDSLYQQVERVERIFPALKVPKTLQSALPFATKPKLEAPSKRTTLEQRRAVPMEKDEKKAHSLLQQLNTIRNEKASKRREQKRTSNNKRLLKKAEEEQWRQQLGKEERKRRYQQQAAQDTRNLKKGRNSSQG